MKHILLFGAGKSAGCLIDYLGSRAAAHDWFVTVADAAADPARFSFSPERFAVLRIDVADADARRALVAKADLVISLLPAALHGLVAETALAERKHLLTASYVDDRMRALAPAVEAAGLLFLCEMGLDPGIDHMSAMALVHRVRGEGGIIRGFRSHTGGLVAPSSDDNPWHYKISWNPRNVVRAGSAGAIYLEQGAVKEKAYRTLFRDCETVNLPGLGPLAFYPNRDSLAYLDLYGLDSASTFLRTTLRHPAFCRGWDKIVEAGLTDDATPVQHGLTLSEWAAPVTRRLAAADEAMFASIGFFSREPVPTGARTHADVLQGLLEKAWGMRENDRDMIVMLHELDVVFPDRPRQLRSRLVVEGESRARTAMAKTVGLPLGIAARFLLEGRFAATGVQIPILPGIYEPVLAELAREGIRFVEETVHTSTG